MSFCPHCGTKLEYCPSCGHALDQTVSTTAPVQSQSAQSQPEPDQEVLLWEGKPHVKAGLKSQTTTYHITSQRVKIIHSGLARKVEEIELTRFRDVRVTQSLTQRALGIGNVIILSTDKTTPELTFEEIVEPEQVKEIIRKAARNEMQRLGVRRVVDG